VRDYLAEWHKYDEKIDIGEIVAYLFRRGVKGKKRSLYSAVHVILKKEAKDGGDGGLSYTSGVGFFKSRQDPSELTHKDTELVHSS
jgi:hypothetical protein